MKIKFNDKDDSGVFIPLSSYLLEPHRVTLGYKDITENLNGFILYEDDEETVVRDCSNFIYRWDVFYHFGNTITYTDLEKERQANINPGEGIAYESPINIGELTNCVADLMFENSLMKLGLEVE